MAEKKKVSILGCGWLGFPLGSALVQKGYDVKGSTTSEDKIESLKQEGIQPYHFSLNLETLPNGLKEFLEAEVVIITLPPKAKNNSSPVLPDILKNLQPWIEQSGIQELILISSTSVYPKSNSIVDEHTDPAPSRKNGHALVEAENIVKALSGISTTILRLGGLIGYDRIPHKFLGFTVTPTNPNGQLNLVHRDDIIAIMQKLMASGITNEVFNIVADEHPKRRTYYETAAHLLHAFPPAWEDEEASYKIVSNEKIKSALEYQFIYPDPLDFLKENLVPQNA